MKLQELLSILNGFALAANVGVFFAGCFFLKDARKLHKELKEYVNNLKNKSNEK